MGWWEILHSSDNHVTLRMSFMPLSYMHNNAKIISGNGQFYVMYTLPQLKIKQAQWDTTLHSLGWL